MTPTPKARFDNSILAKDNKDEAKEAEKVVDELNKDFKGKKVSADPNAGAPKGPQEVLDEKKAKEEAEAKKKEGGDEKKDEKKEEDKKEEDKKDEKADEKKEEKKDEKKAEGEKKEEKKEALA